MNAKPVSTYQHKRERSLRQLMSLIQLGTEFPDAVSKVRVKLQLTPRQIRELIDDYDNYRDHDAP